jgi:hypothetical protein
MKEIELANLRSLPWGILLLGAFFGSIAYFSKEKFALFLFLLVIVGGSVVAIISWKNLRKLNELRPVSALATPLSLEAAEEHRYLWTIPRPRQVRLRSTPRVIWIALPLSWILIIYFASQEIRTRDGAPVDYSGLFLLLFVGAIWSFVGIGEIRSAVRDRRLLTDGDIAIATVTDQQFVGRKQRRSEIHYRFKDGAGLGRYGNATDGSHSLYEDMTTPVFYNPADPNESVPLVTASYDLKLS